VQFKEEALAYYDSHQCTRDNEFTKAAHEANMRNGLLIQGMLPEYIVEVIKLWKVDNTVPATEAPFPDRPERQWTVTEANLAGLGNLDVDDGAGNAVTHPASFYHILDALVTSFRKTHHKKSAKTKLMSVEQKKMSVADFHAKLLKMARNAGYRADSPFWLTCSRRSLQGDCIVKCVPAHGVASLKVQMMSVQAETLEEALEEAEAIESNLMEVHAGLGTEFLPVLILPRAASEPRSRTGF